MNIIDKTNYIDFGLPFLVADRNIGASAPEDYGLFVSEALLDGRLPTSQGYAVQHRMGLNGAPKIIMRSISEVLQDVGLQLLKIPTEEQMTLLLRNSEWRYDAARKGYTLISRINGAEVFFPAAGYYTSSAQYRMAFHQTMYERLSITGDRRDALLVEDEAVMHGGISPVPCGRFLLRKTYNRFAAIGWTGGTPVLQMCGSEVRVVTKPDDIWMPIRTVLCT